MRAKAAPLRLALVLAALAAGCQMCPREAGPLAPAQDAGPLGAVATDLRSALILIYPELRWSKVVGGRGGLLRVVDFPEERPLLPSLEEGLLQQKFTAIREEEGVVRAERPPLSMEATREGGQVHLRLFLRLDDSMVNRIFHSPTPMSSGFLSNSLPSPSGATLVKESFELQLDYRAQPDRAGTLVRRLVEGLEQVGWSTEGGHPPWEELLPDGGTDPLPQELDLVLVYPPTLGKLELERRGGRVTMDYHQPLVQ